MKRMTTIGLMMGALALSAGCSKDENGAPAPKAGPAAEAAAEVPTATPAGTPTPTPETAPTQAGGDGEVAEISVEDVEAMLASDGCTPIDANNIVTRKKHGTIPGATLLSHYDKYEMSELPADKSRKLVFFCANQSCGASHTAAEKALLAGYTDVAVLPAGIAGWRAAGKQVTTIQ